MIEQLNKRLKEEYNLELLRDEVKLSYWVTNRERFCKVNLTDELIETTPINVIIDSVVNIFNSISIGRDQKQKVKFNKNFKKFYEAN